MITTKEHLDPGLETETERYKIHTIGLEVFKFVGSFKIRITSPAQRTFPADSLTLCQLFQAVLVVSRVKTKWQWKTQWLFPTKNNISVRDQSLILRMELFFHHLSHKAIARCHATQEGGIKMTRNSSNCTKISRPFFDQPTRVCF